MINRAGSPIQSTVALFCALLLPVSLTFAQQPAGPPPVSTAAQQAAPPLSPDQLNNLVAPVALYPDPLLGQVLAASTYPLEIVEAQQWLQKNGNLTGAQLMDAAKQQNWDPSIQALVAFPDALKLLSNDIRWTTDLGNAFLAQQSDVMSAVQGMRARAQANGRLTTTPQQVVTTDTQNDQSAIEIQPADPQVIYVPEYNPAYVWGPPAYGAYPDLGYSDGFGLGFGFGFGPGIYVGSFFPGWGGWGGWGWGCGWFGNGLFVNAGFFNLYGFRGGFGGRFAAGVALEDAVHGPTIRAIEWAFHIPTAPWRAASIRPDSTAAAPTAVNSTVSAAAIPPKQREAALMQAALMQGRGRRMAHIQWRQPGGNWQCQASVSKL